MESSRGYFVGLPRHRRGLHRSKASRGASKRRCSPGPSTSARGIGAIRRRTSPGIALACDLPVQRLSLRSHSRKIRLRITTDMEVLVKLGSGERPIRESQVTYRYGTWDDKSIRDNGFKAKLKDGATDYAGAWGRRLERGEHSIDQSCITSRFSFSWRYNAGTLLPEIASRILDPPVNRGQQSLHGSNGYWCGRFKPGSISVNDLGNSDSQRRSASC